MAYQPKYSSKARKASRQEPPVAQQRAQPAQRTESGSRALAVMLAAVVVPVSIVATVLALEFVFDHVGRPQQAARSAPQQLFSMGEVFHQDAQQREAAALERLAAAVTAPEKTLPSEALPPETQPPVVHQHYAIPDDAIVAPKPNQDCFGVSEDPTQLRQVLLDAAWLLGDGNLYFQPDGQRYEQESQVRWFLDESMFAVTWKEVHDGSVYTFSEVKLQDPSQFRRHLAGGTYGSDMQFMTTEMAEEVNAVVASNGDFYRFRDFGAVVYEGVARRVEGTYAETCYIDRSGNMHFTYGGDVLTVEDVQAFVDEHDISFSLAFGPILVDNGQEVDHTWYGVGEITEGYARSALLQMGELHYIVVTANTQGNYQEIPTVAMFRKNIMATGCINAYCLDGGQTASIVMNNELINRPVYGQQRKISDIIYFATAVPEGA